MQPRGWGWQHPTTILSQGGRRWDHRSWWRSRHLSLGFEGQVAREEHLLPTEIKALSKQLERKHHSRSSLPHGQPAALLTVRGRTCFSKPFLPCTSPHLPLFPDTNQKTLFETFQSRR